MTASRHPGSPPPGLVVGGRGDPDDELLADGQEEVFARSEVELGRIEHDTGAGSGPEPDQALRKKGACLPVPGPASDRRDGQA